MEIFAEIAERLATATKVNGADLNTGHVILGFIASGPYGTRLLVEPREVVKASTWKGSEHTWRCVEWVSKSGSSGEHNFEHDTWIIVAG